MEGKEKDFLEEVAHELGLEVCMKMDICEAEDGVILRQRSTRCQAS